LLQLFAQGVHFAEPFFSAIKLKALMQTVFIRLNFGIVAR